MSIKISSFLGKMGFEMRRRLPVASSNLYLRIQSLIRNSESTRYMNNAYKAAQSGNLLPLYVAIETINRCNGKCSFCPANVNSETRPFMKMSDETFNKILDEIEGWGDWDGVFSLYVNNEPFIDKRMCDMLHQARIRLPKASMLLFSNGSLLTPEIMDSISKDVDMMFINNYSKTYDLNPNIEKIYHYVKENEERFQNIKIVIQKRYVNEYLTNRAGNAPNKKKALDKITLPCLMPFTDMTIYPNGQVGLCCSDVLETINMGNISDKTLKEIYNSSGFNSLREKMLVSRTEIPICSNCDFIDSGIRLDMMKRNNKRW